MTALTSLIILALLATVVTLGLGIGSMAYGGSFDARHATQFMFTRIGLQGLAILLLIVALVITL